ncbi:MAG: ParB N-terminal domain-containing protein [Anaerohalosphaeraceae bacterium]
MTTKQAGKRSSQTCLANSKNENGQTCLTVQQINPYLLKPSPENEKIYGPINRDDPEVVSIAEDMRKNGLLEPIVASRDKYIISGHRRREAAIVAGLKLVHYRTLDIDRGDEFDDASSEFVKLLTSYNRQRIKNNAEMLREVIIQADPNDAYEALLEHRRNKTKISVETINVGHRGKRKRISDVKSQMAESAIRIVDENRAYWPLSDRQIHYRLLNDPPLRNTGNPKSRYRNDSTCYGDLCDLLTRLRLTSRIPMYAIADPTRQTSKWYIHNNVQDFSRGEIDDFLTRYYRNLQQSQALYIEVVAEKMTVQGIISPVCEKYCINYTIGRGYSSLPARNEIVKRFKKSGKEKLLLLVMSDYDPEGIDIGESILQSLREDLHIYNAEAVRVGLNREHVERFGLTDNPAEAKESSARYKKFVQQYGKKVYELEALTPSQLQGILTETIDSVIDIPAFNAELDKEKRDAAYLVAVRKRLIESAIDIIPEIGGDE